MALKMSSSKYPWLYYSLSYVEFELDVCIKDYPESMDDYIYRDTNENVKVTTTSEFECWYKIDDASEREKFKAIAQATDTASGSATKPGDDGEKVEYFGLFFTEGDDIEECIETLISKYIGDLSFEELNKLLNVWSSRKPN